MLIDKIRTPSTSTLKQPSNDDKLLNLLTNPNNALVEKLRKLLKKDLGIDLAEQKAERSSKLKVAAAKLHKPYINKVTVTCSLCNTSTVHSLVMQYSIEQKCYTAFYGILSEPPSIPVKELRLVADNCSSCFGILAYWPKEHLIELLINRIKRDNLYIEKLRDVNSNNFEKEREVI